MNPLILTRLKSAVAGAATTGFPDVFERIHESVHPPLFARDFVEVTDELEF